MSEAITQGIQVTVEPCYLPEHSFPTTARYVFAYKVVIANLGTEIATLQTRHWIITNALGYVEEVRGAGVVGQTPTLAPGEQYEYQSFCVLPTQRGTMHGNYGMMRTDGRSFNVKIAPFVLATPNSERMLN